MAVYKLENKIQNYAWGSKTAIPELLGYSNTENEPMAELWMGAHPKSPSKAVLGDGNIKALDSMISESPAGILGDTAARRFGGRLPYLFKVLAAGEPLSIQAHPDLQQAEEGFRRENEAGVPLDAFERNYKDDNHKPEIICALTDYHAMRGFRSLEEIESGFSKIMIPELQEAAASLGAARGGQVKPVLKAFFTRLMGLEESARESLIGNALKAAEKNEFAESGWILKFSELYPGDIGIVSPLYLNVVTLKPGQAMYLPAGELHAYLEGLGIELMANSDNVLRGGLTPKHVDVPELLSTLSFEPGKPEILKPVKANSCEYLYKTPADEFVLSRIELSGKYDIPRDGYGPAMPSIFICLDGELSVSDGASELAVSRGGSFFADGGSAPRLQGRALLYRASVPSGVK